MRIIIGILTTSALLVGYAWLVYPALLLISLFVRSRGSARSGANGLVRVSVIIPVHNEESCVAPKLENCLSLDYPPSLIEILVVSDHSTDATEKIVEEFASREPRIRLLRTEGRAGKSAAQNLAVENASGEILLLTDAGTLLQSDALGLMIADFADPKVGLVTATLCLSKPTNAISKGQGVYWEYELFLRQAESDLGILATATGAAMAIRRSAFRPLEEYYGDDCILPLDVRLQGLRVLHEPRAIAFDALADTIDSELRSRIRMTARNWSGILSRPALLNPLRFPFTSWGLISHKLLRWLTPFLLVALYVTNSLLVIHGRFITLWLAQSVFYLAAFLGWIRTRRKKKAGIFSHPFAFCLANLGFLLGMLRVLRAKRIVAF